MQWSSKSIGRLATALAKAQAELKNPEKTLTATIYPERRNGERSSATGAGDDGGRTFNYASLASGLEVVRRSLSRHGIAVVQATAMDDTGQLVKLTTVLAHSSGEWIASDWPVCSVKETETPHRMGMALTYARRYALFTLVGIAGEDDVDAPELRNPQQQSSVSSQLNGPGHSHLKPGLTRDYNRRNGGSPAGAPLEAEQSAAIRDQIMAELANLGSADEAAMWAHRRIGEKNRLRTEDAQRIEEAFRQKITAYLSAVSENPEHSPAAAASIPRMEPAERPNESPIVHPTGRGPQLWHPPARRLQSKRIKSSKSERPRAGDQCLHRADGASPSPAEIPCASDGIDKSMLALPELRRVRDRDHVRHVAQQACLICGRTPCDAHHLRFTQARALGRKVSDEFTVPLCRGHHRELHRQGDEAAWWTKRGIDPAAAARTHWLETHPLPFDRNPMHPLSKREGEKKADDQSTKSAAKSNANRRTPKRNRVLSKTAPINEPKPLADGPTL